MSPRYRNSTLRSWRDGGRTRRIWMLLEGAVATLIGVGVPLLIAWLLLVRQPATERMQPTGLYG